jgi:urea carboxylase
VRGYLAIAGGLDVPVYLGSRATFPGGNFGGYQGRYLQTGDSLPIGYGGPATPMAMPEVRDERRAHLPPGADTGGARVLA